MFHVDVLPRQVLRPMQERDFSKKLKRPLERNDVAVRVVVVRIVDVGRPDFLPPPVNGLRGVGDDSVINVGDRFR